MEYLQVDIYKCEDDHIHVVLGGRGRGEVTLKDFESFAKFASICHEFVTDRVSIPPAILDAFAEETDK